MAAEATSLDNGRPLLDLVKDLRPVVGIPAIVGIEAEVEVGAVVLGDEV